MSDPSERLARLREEGRSRPVGSRWWAEDDAQFLLAIAEAALAVDRTWSREGEPWVPQEHTRALRVLRAALEGP